jgi:hypothetical protein
MPHRDIEWPLMIIQCAINTRDPELIAAILQEEAKHDVDQPDEWVDERGDTILRDPEWELRVLGWPSEWRRVFGTP